MRYPVITLCGSTKFEDTYKEIAKQLSLQGHVVLTTHVFSHSTDKSYYESLNPIEKDLFMKQHENMHYQMIDMSDAIFVVNPDNYIGESTKQEITYAKYKQKDILYLYDPDKK